MLSFYSKLSTELLLQRLASLEKELPRCDCAASGNAMKPKQHGADPHAKNCAVYLHRDLKANAKIAIIKVVLKRRGVPS